MASTYEELRRMARHYLESDRHTLQPTALVHEAFLKLTAGGEASWREPSHFVAAIARTMRHVLVNHARARRTLKRGETRPAPLDETLELFDRRCIDVAEFDEALTRLARIDARQAEIVLLRFFAGLSEEQIATQLGISTRTVERDWRMARAWLRLELAGTREGRA